MQTQLVIFMTGVKVSGWQDNTTYFGHPPAEAEDSTWRLSADPGSEWPDRNRQLHDTRFQHCKTHQPWWEQRQHIHRRGNHTFYLL